MYDLLVNKKHPLDESYIPENMIIISEPTGIKEDGNYQNMLPKEVYYYFKFMQHDALKDGYEIFIDSSYRSYAYQQELYEKLIQKKGEEYSEKYLAIPGTSEHQTGLAIDIIARRGNIMMENPNGNDAEMVWLKNNAYKYGFILRYPESKEDITGINFEPWHYRFVGTTLAYRLFHENITLEEYHMIKRR